MKFRKAFVTGTGRRVRTIDGRRFVYDHLRKQAASLPPVKDDAGVLQSHYANMKRAYIVGGEVAVNSYLKEVRMAHRRAKWENILIRVGMWLHLISKEKVNVEKKTN